MSDKQVATTREGMDIAQSSDGTVTFVPENVTQVIEFAKLMSQSDLALPEFLRGNTGACMAISMQAYRWGMEPFAVANKAYSVNNRIAYESQLIAAVINCRAPLKNRLVVEYEGEGNTRKCVITGCFEGEDIDRVVKSPPFNTITPKNSPLWKSDPDQQLFYYTVRSWSRRYQPELLMGIYSIDEFKGDTSGPENARDITPPAPTREDFKEPEFILWDNTGVEAGEFTDADEYVSALCSLMDDMLKIEDHKGFHDVWKNNVSAVDDLDDACQLAARTFFNEMKPDVSHETETEADDEAPEGEPEGEPEGIQDDEAAPKFHVYSVQGDDDIYHNPKGWHDACMMRIKGFKSIDGVKGFKKANDAEFSRLDPDFHNEVLLVNKAIDDQIVKLSK